MEFLYTAVNSSTLSQMVENGLFDLSTVCTSPMTNTHFIFDEYGWGGVITGLDSWDVSNVTSMRKLFRGYEGKFYSESFYYRFRLKCLGC